MWAAVLSASYKRSRICESKLRVRVVSEVNNSTSCIILLFHCVGCQLDIECTNAWVPGWLYCRTVERPVSGNLCVGDSWGVLFGGNLTAAQLVAENFWYICWSSKTITASLTGCSKPSVIELAVTSVHETLRERAECLCSRDLLKVRSWNLKGKGGMSLLQRSFKSRIPTEQRTKEIIVCLANSWIAGATWSIHNVT